MKVFFRIKTRSDDLTPRLDFDDDDVFFDESPEKNINPESSDFKIPQSSPTLGYLPSMDISKLQIQDFYLELGLIVFFVIYFAIWLQGRSLNKTIAQTWYFYFWRLVAELDLRLGRLSRCLSGSNSSVMLVWVTVQFYSEMDPRILCFLLLDERMSDSFMPDCRFVTTE